MSTTATTRSIVDTIDAAIKAVLNQLKVQISSKYEQHSALKAVDA